MMWNIQWHLVSTHQYNSVFVTAELFENICKFQLPFLSFIKPMEGIEYFVLFIKLISFMGQTSSISNSYIHLKNHNQLRSCVWSYVFKNTNESRYCYFSCWRCMYSTFILCDVFWVCMGCYCWHKTSTAWLQKHNSAWHSNFIFILKKFAFLVDVVGVNTPFSPLSYKEFWKKEKESILFFGYNQIWIKRRVRKQSLWLLKFKTEKKIFTRISTCSSKY